MQVMGEETSFIIDIPGHTLPGQCQLNPSRCHTLIREEGEERRRYLAISAVGNVVLVDLEGGSSQVPYVVSTSAEDRPQCDPVDLFSVIDAHLPYLSAACEDASGSTLMYLSFFLMIEESGLVAMDLILSPVTLLSTSGFSQTILVPNQDCSNSQDSKFFVVADSVIQSFPATGLVTREFTPRLQLENCSVVSYVEYVGTSKNFIVHCLNGVAVNYSTCSDLAEYHYLAVGGIPFLSSSSLTAMYRTDSIEVVLSSNGSVVSLNHSVGEIRFGRCLGNFFAAVATNGSLYIININTGWVSAAIAQVCGSEGSCVLPAFSSRGFTVYDFQNSSLFSVSFVEGCEYPIVELPDDTSFLLPSFISATRNGQRACECPNGTISPGTTSQPDTGTTLDDGITSPSPIGPIVPPTTPPGAPITPPDNMTTQPPVATTTPPTVTTTPPTDNMSTPDGTAEMTPRVGESIGEKLTTILVPISCALFVGLTIIIVGIIICIIIYW